MPPHLASATALLLAEATADKPQAFAALFLGQLLSWAGVPALGAAAMGAAGVLAQQGVLHLWAILVVGTLGAEAGGVLGWGLGRRAAEGRFEGEGRLASRGRSALHTGSRLADRWGRFMVFFTPSWVSGALAIPFEQFARWNLLAAALWNLGAGLSAYGVASAVGGGSLRDTAIPLVVAGLAIVAIAFLGLRRRRARRVAPGQPSRSERT